MDRHLKAILSSHEGKRDELIPILQQAQVEFGYLSKQVMLEIAKFTRVPESRVYAVASFYAQFRFTPIGRKHVTVCRGTACYVRGVSRILGAIEKHLGIKEGQTTEDMEYSLETVACIGACGLAPNIVINKQTYGHLTINKISEIFTNIRSKEKGEQSEE